MFTCRVINVWSDNSAYVVEFKSRKEAYNFKIRKESDEYVDKVEVTSHHWNWVEQIIKYMY